MNALEDLRHYQDLARLYRDLIRDVEAVGDEPSDLLINQFESARSKVLDLTNLLYPDF